MFFKNRCSLIFFFASRPEKRLQGRCLPKNIPKFLGGAFLYHTSGGCFCSFFSKQWFHEEISSRDLIYSIHIINLFLQCRTCSTCGRLANVLNFLFKACSFLFLSTELNLYCFTKVIHLTRICREKNIPMDLCDFKTAIYSVLVSIEAVIRRYFIKKVFLKCPQNSQENTFAGVSFSIKLQTWCL